ncbi:unnamed protein product [Darwinula stevensoni]|uniref:Peptidase S1 domain-containing protein n=1 Tax=Darwinula stevensoni TaxID=69355 RepID=A0A7R8XDG2_9CRUS|nr:unnamed protein product [Darwinula stevensoni]CAG0893000.1 unnamed protein product [Darwinula stevensoni]
MVDTTTQCGTRPGFSGFQTEIASRQATPAANFYSWITRFVSRAWRNLRHGDTAAIHVEASESNAAPVQSNVTDPLIVGGEFAQTGEAPFMVRLVINFPSGPSSCGGSVINEKNVLTAAHCLVDTSEKATGGIAIAGTNYVDTTTNPVTVGPTNQSISYTSYDYHSSYDIAIVHLSSSFVFNDNVQPICLPTSDDKNLAGCTNYAYGWGATSAPGGQLSPNLKKLRVNVKSMAFCSMLGFLKSAQLCISAYTGPAGVCFQCTGLGKRRIPATPNTTLSLSQVEESSSDHLLLLPRFQYGRRNHGGPVVTTYNGRLYQSGITSYGSLSCTKSDVFTRVSYYNDWIAANIK